MYASTWICTKVEELRKKEAQEPDKGQFSRRRGLSTLKEIDIGEPMIE